MESMDADRSWSTPEQAGADGLAAPPRRAAHVRRAEDYEAPPADALAAAAGPRPITAPFPVPAPSPLAPPVSRPPAPSWEEVPPPPPLGSVRAPFPAPDAAPAPFAAAAISDGGPLAEPSPAAFPPFVPGGALGGASDGVPGPAPVPPDSVPAAVPTLPPAAPLAAWSPTPPEPIEPAARAEPPSPAEPAFSAEPALPVVPMAVAASSPAASSPAAWTPPAAEPVIQDAPPAPFEATAESAAPSYPDPLPPAAPPLPWEARDVEPPVLVEPAAPAPLTGFPPPAPWLVEASAAPPPALPTPPADSPDPAGADVERTAPAPAIPAFPPSAFPPPASAPAVRSAAPDSFDALLAADPASTGPDPAEPLPVSPFLGADRPDRADPPIRPDLDRSTVAERVGLALAILLPPIGLVAGVVGMVASARRRGWVIGITKATTIVGVVLSIAAGIGGSVLADALRANAAHDALEAQSAAMCAAFAESPELLSAPDFGWPAPAGSIPDSIASMQDYAARWDAIAASAPEEIAPEAQAVAEAARELAGSVEVSRRVDDAQNIAVMTSVAQASRLPAWAAEYCPAAP